MIYVYVGLGLFILFLLIILFSILSISGKCSRLEELLEYQIAECKNKEG
jgi:hypothetical protein